MKKLVLNSIAIGAVFFILAYIDYEKHGPTIPNDGTMQYHYTHMSWIGNVCAWGILACILAPVLVWGWKKIVR